MKLTLITTTLFAGMVLLQAAEAVPFTYMVSGCNEKIWSSKPVTAEKPVKVTLDPKSRWGMDLTFRVTKTEPNMMYRICFNTKGTAFVYFKDFAHFNGKIINTFPVGKGPITLFSASDASKKSGWSFVFEKRFKEVEITQLSVEKLGKDEIYKNILPNEGLEPGYWYGIWGNQDGCFPKLVKDDNSPAGKLLHFDASKPGDGNRVTMPLPFLPEKKYEISFWIRSKTPDMILWQVAYGGINHTRLGLKKEWTEVKVTGVTPKTERAGGMMLMFFGNNRKPLPEFELGGVDFHYVK